jgi:uncharacterized transporter YbjL
MVICCNTQAGKVVEECFVQLYVLEGKLQAMGAKDLITVLHILFCFFLCVIAHHVDYTILCGDALPLLRYTF